MEWQTLTYKPLYRLLAQHLETRILSGDFPRGAFLPPVRSLMKLFSVSLATVRSALEVLEKKGMIERRHGSGIRVILESSPATGEAAEINISEDVRDLFNLRLVLEPAALEQAFDRLDRDRLRTALETASPAREDLYAMDSTMHDEIAQQCPNRHLRQALGDVMKKIELYREIKFRSIGGRTEEDFTCVRAIITAILAGRREEARHELERHIAFTRDGLLEVIAERQ